MARTTGQDKVRELQRTLYRAAKADSGRRFHALFDKVFRRDVLERAWGQVRANRGAAGIDRTTIADVEEYGIGRLLDELAADLKDGRWRPLPARRVFIPKPGREELRPLSIPTVRDRIVQTAVKLVIEPIFEADFLPCSFGFRPRRSQHDALQVLIDQSWKGRRWALETDIANCFEAIPHSGLMSAIEERVSDRHLLKLLRAMLRAGVMQDGAVHRDVTGTPQGGCSRPSLPTSICTGSTGSGPSAERECWCATRMTWWCCATASGRPKRHWCRCGRSWPSWAWSSSRPRPGSCTYGTEARAWISSAFITVACAASAATGTCGSSPAGPHERQCKGPAIGSVRSRTPSGSATRSK